MGEFLCVSAQQYITLLYTYKVPKDDSPSFFKNRTLAFIMISMHVMDAPYILSAKYVLDLKPIVIRIATWRTQWPELESWTAIHSKEFWKLAYLDLDI